MHDAGSKLPDGRQFARMDEFLLFLAQAALPFRCLLQEHGQLIRQVLSGVEKPHQHTCREQKDSKTAGIVLSRDSKRVYGWEMKEGASKATAHDRDEPADSAALPGADGDGNEEWQEYNAWQNRKDRGGESKCTGHREERNTIAENEWMDSPRLPHL